MKKDDAFTKYLFNKQKNNKKADVELQLSDSGNEQASKQKSGVRQLKLDDLFNFRQKTRQNTETPVIQQKQKKKSVFSMFSVSAIQNQIRKQRQKKAQQLLKNAQNTKNSLKNKQQKEKTYKFINKPKQQIQVPIYEAKNMISEKQRLLQQKRQLERQKRRQQKEEQQRKKNQQENRRKSLTFKRFLNNISVTKSIAKSNQFLKHRVPSQASQLNNISIFNKIQEQSNQQQICQAIRSNTGMTYKKTTIQRQKMPTPLLKYILTYNFKSTIIYQQNKRVPNSFQDQQAYIKTFHYLIMNQCIADIYLRIEKIRQSNAMSIPIIISDFKTLSNGFVQFNMNQRSKQQNKNSTEKTQKILLKNLSLSKNRLGLITNSKNFQFQHFGVPCEKNKRIFSFICFIVTPQSKQDLKSEVKGLSCIQIPNLQAILNQNHTNRVYIYDLQKISTHIRQYQAVKYLSNTQVAPYVYEPSLIQKHLEMIPQIERNKLQQILQKLKLQYNNTQYQSIREMALRQSGLVLLQGPPGTGKTTTLMGLLAAEYEYFKNVVHFQDKRKILICAPSNAAIDHITKRLVCEGLISTSNQNNNLSRSINASGIEQNAKNTDGRVFPKILRVGIVQTSDPDIIGVSLDDLCDKKVDQAKCSSIKRNHMTITQIKQSIVQVAKEINLVKKKKNMQQWEIQAKVAQLKYKAKNLEGLLFNFRKQRISLKQTYNQIQNRLLDEADIILTTLSSSGSQKMQKIRGYVGCLIIDEAAQSTEPTLLIPFQSGVRKILMIGDPCQLPSTTMSQDSSVTLFNRSLFQRFLDYGIKPYFLNIQYRMAPLIRQFPSSAFYNNRLIDAESVIQRYKLQKQQNQDNQQQIKDSTDTNISSIQQFFDRNSIFIDIKFGQQQFHSNSYRNVWQCKVVKKLLIDFIKNTKLTIGVITPYQSQRKYLIKQLKSQLQLSSQLAKQLQKYHQQNKQKMQQQNNVQNQQNSGILGNLAEIQQGECEQQQSNKKEDDCQNKIKQTNLPDNKDIQQQVANENISMNQNIQNQNDNKKQSTVIMNKKNQPKTLQQLLNQRIMINTVDSFQGQQKDIIIVSTVRANNRKDIGFMKDQRRINVALSRSKHLLIVVGHGDTIGSNQTWNKYLQWSQNHNCYYQIKQREGVTAQLIKIHKGPNNERIKRMRYSTLTKDLRRQQVQQIRKEDFGMGTKGKKKVKKDRFQNHSYHQKTQNQIKYVQKGTINKLIQQKAAQKTIQQQDQRKAQELIEEKRLRQQQAIMLQETNKRIRELQRKIAMNPNNPYSQFFY